MAVESLFLHASISSGILLIAAELMAELFRKINSVGIARLFVLQLLKSNLNYDRSILE